MNKSRFRKLNDQKTVDGPILYWIDRDLRLFDNWAVFAAQEFSRQKNQPFALIYNLVSDYLGGGERQLQFKIQALKETAKLCEEKNIPFLIITEPIEKTLPKFIEKHKIGLLITDFNPLRENTKWKNSIAKKIEIPFIQVDTHNIIPCWHASPKQEFAAYTFRPKVNKLLPEFLDDFPNLMTQELNWPNFPKINWSEIEKLKANPEIKPLTWLKGGEHQAKLMLKSFIGNRIENYSEKRNDPNEDNLSKLSPYLHYGNISSQRIALEIKKAHSTGKIKKSDAESFLEELIVRRELSDNFCFYNPNYDNFDGFPEWAQKSLNEHRKDKREYTYTKSQFEKAQTHDDLWNSAQMQMVNHGKMHGYLRMYWAKKILEWTESPEKALEIAIYLNDKYEIDGRDPNGYVGCAWSIGGVHDRAWFDRPIFGKVRYMNFNGAKKKFDVEKYIESNLKTS